MATLLLTAVGTAVAGPIGGAIGAIIGQQVDSAVFAPKKRHGPRLGDLAVQISSYGAAIPKLFGRMRVAGTVIWATDLVETRSESGGGKGRPSSVAYSYSASFAVALSARPILSVGRIWADGKLLRGAGGDFKTSATLRLHTGDEDQPADPLIAAAEGIAETPAFRGIAYAVFENLALEDFGNRIPSLTFEVEADGDAVAIGEIAAELSDFAIAPEVTPTVAGYAAGGDSVRSAIAALTGVVPLSLSDDGESLRLAAAPPQAVVLGDGDLCARTEIIRRASGTVPDEVSIAYYEPERDSQTSLQRASMTGSGGRNVDRQALAAAMSADDAKGLAEFRLAALRARRLGAKAKLMPARAGLRPGDAVILAGEGGIWQVRRWTLEAGGLQLELERVTPTLLPQAAPANPGRPTAEEDLPHGPTILRLLDLPLGGTSGDRPLLFAVAAGESAGWRRARLETSFDGATWSDAGRTAAPAVLGEAVTALPPGGSALFDDHGSVEVELRHDGMSLQNATDLALTNGGNLALIGDELVQFGRAEWLGGTRYRLSRLLRGRRGSEWAATGHEAGEGFTLIDRQALVVIEAPGGSSGSEARMNASGVGDTLEPATAALIISAESLRPPPPAHLRAERLGGGDIAISWVRRSRLGWAWPSGADTPLAEETEAYRVTISGSGFERSATVEQPELTYSVADQASDGAAGAMLIEVAQIGTHAVSRTASTTLD